MRILGHALIENKYYEEQQQQHHHYIRLEMMLLIHNNFDSVVDLSYCCLNGFPWRSLHFMNVRVVASYS